MDRSIAIPKVTAVGELDIDGKMILKNPDRLKADLKKHYCDKKILLTIEPFYERRSKAQNRYYWSVVVGVFLKSMKDYGNTQLTAKKVHDIFKNKWLNEELFDVHSGQSLGWTDGSTALLTTKQFCEYCTDIQNWAKSVFEIDIPNPNEEEFCKWIEESPEAEIQSIIHLRWDNIKQNRNTKDYGRNEESFS